MAKEQWHSWGKILIIAAGLIFTGGTFHHRIQTTEEDVIVVCADTKTNERRIDGIEMSQAEEREARKGDSKTLNRIEQTLTIQTAIINQQAIDIAIIKTKVEK